MTYRELVTEAQRTFESSNATDIKEHVAIEFDVTGNASGIFYLEIREGTVYVEPYNYYDHDAVIHGTAEAILDFLSGKESLKSEIASNKISVEGDLEKVKLLDEIHLKKQRQGI